MAGILFLKTCRFEEIISFYCREVGMTLWLEQPDIRILRHENFLLGWNRHESSDTSGVMAFFYPERNRVDEMYRKLKPWALHAPKLNPKYRIYHFYAKDPENRLIEFQCFLHELPEWG